MLGLPPTLLLMLLMTGCGGSSSGPDLHPVAGTVKMDGQPLTEAMLIFTPKGGGVTAIANTDSKGDYILEYSSSAKGVPSGEYAVSISTFRPEGEVSDGAPSLPPAKERVPDVYNQKTTLAVKVPGDAGSYSFDLKAGAGKVTDPPVPKGRN